MSEMRRVVLNLSVFMVVSSSILARGLRLALVQMMALLHSARLAVLALVANFGPMPTPAYVPVEARRPSRFRRQE